MSPRLELEVESATYAPGDTVRGSVVVVEGGRSRFVEVSLEYRESTPATDSVADRTPPVRVHEGDLVAGTRLPFALALPAGAFPNYESRASTLTWEVHARSDEFGVDTRAGRPLVVS